MNLTAYDLAMRYLGVAEARGDDTNPHIRAWLADAGISHAQDETPWCGAFMWHLFGRLLGPGLLGKYTPTFPARARWWLTVGRPVALSEARVGFDVVVLKRGDGEQPGPDVLDAPGHVGLFGGLRDGFVRLLGGNQGNAVSVASFPAARVLGVRRLCEERA